MPTLNSAELAQVTQIVYNVSIGAQHYTDAAKEIVRIHKTALARAEMEAALAAMPPASRGGICRQM